MRACVIYHNKRQRRGPEGLDVCLCPYGLVRVPGSSTALSISTGRFSSSAAEPAASLCVTFYKMAFSPRVLLITGSQKHSSCFSAVPGRELQGDHNPIIPE